MTEMHSGEKSQCFIPSKLFLALWYSYKQNKGVDNVRFKPG